MVMLYKKFLCEGNWAVGTCTPQQSGEPIRRIPFDSIDITEVTAILYSSYVLL